MKSIREVVRDVIAQRVLPWIEHDGISRLILPDQITPADCAKPIKCKYPHDVIRHPAHELGIGLTGRAPYCIDGKRFVFTPGRILLLPTGTPHGMVQSGYHKTEDIDLDQPSVILWLLAYPFGVLVQMSRVVEDMYMVTPSRIFPEHHAGGLVGRLLEEMHFRLPNCARIGRSILIEFMEQCIRATFVTMDAGFTPALRGLRRRGSTRPAKGRGGSARSRRKTTRDAASQLPIHVQAAKEFIHYHYNTPLSMEDIAEAADSSEDYLGRQFKATIGMTVFRYLQNVRMEAAKELLLTDLKVSEVALLVGFEDQCYFSRLFRQINGTTPLRYRRQAAKTNLSVPPLRNYKQPRKSHKTG